MKTPDPEYVQSARDVLDTHDGFKEEGDAFPDAWCNREEWMESRVASLLCDIRHYCHATGVDFYCAEHLGYLYYQDSLLDQDDPSE